MLFLTYTQLTSEILCFIFLKVKLNLHLSQKLNQLKNIVKYTLEVEYFAI